MLTLRIPWTNQTLDKHVGDSTDSDNEEREDGELEEGEVEEEFDENPQQKDDAKENNRENKNSNETNVEQDNSIDVNNHLNLAGQKFRRRDYPHHHHHHLPPPRLNSTGGVQDKRNKHDLRRKRHHSGEERDERNRKSYKRGRFRGGPLPDMPEDAEDDDMMGPVWPPRGQNRGQRKQQSDMMSNENSESAESGDQPSSSNPPMESKSEQSINSDETSSPIHDINDEENINSDDKQERLNRPRGTRANQQQIENRGRRYYDGNSNSNNRRTNDRDRSSWQDRSGGGGGNNPNNNPNNNQRFRSDAGSSTSHGPPLCKFFVENRCMKGNDCLFSHDFKPPKKMDVCKYYVQNKGYCQKNESCPYLHGEFPCKFFHTGTKDCMQGDRCKFSHDPITNEDIRFAFERYLSDTDDINRQNRGNSNSNIHHTNNSPAVNFDVIGAASLPLPPPIPGSLTDPSNFPMIPNLMDLLLLQNSSLKASSNASNVETTTTNTANTSQSSPPAQRPSLFTDTLSSEKVENEESASNKTVSSTNSASPSSSSSTQNPTSTSDNPSASPVSTANTTPAMTTTTNSTCPLPLPPSSMTNHTLNLPSPFGRLPPPNLTRAPSSLLPPPPPGLFPLNTLGTGRVPILFPTNNGLPLPPPPGSILDVKLLAQAAALAAVNAAVANKFTTPSHHHSQASSPQLGRDIDERDRQLSNTMRGDIDERPSDVYNRPTTTTNLGLLQTSSNVNPSTSVSASSPTLTSNDEHMKTNNNNNNIQDLFRTTRPTSIETLSSSTPTNSTAGPSFDFISMLEQLKQPRQASSSENAHDSLEIRSSSNPSSVYLLRPVLVSFKPYPLPDQTTDPRIIKYKEKMSLWSEQARLERFKTPLLSTPNYSLPLRSQQPTPPPPPSMSNDTNSSRDPRLLRNSVSSSKIGVSLLPSPNPFVRPNDNLL